MHKAQFQARPSRHLTGNPRRSLSRGIAQFQRKIINFLIPMSFIALAAGCGGGGGGSSSSTGATTGASTASAVVSGSVGDGPITAAQVVLTDANGAVVAQTTSNAQARFTVSLPPNVSFPVVVTATGGTDLVTGSKPDFRMKSVVSGGGAVTANVNPFSTLIVEAASRMSGGATSKNLANARRAVTSQFGFGLDSAFVADPITSPVTDYNVAHMVKASEALGEVIRRTRDAHIAMGTVVNGNAVMLALAADLSDGVLDGRGKGANPAITTTATVAGAQVLVESLSNSLKVNNADATSLMDSAISTTHPGATTRTSKVRITFNMLNQARASVRAAEAISPSAAFTTIRGLLDGLSANMLPSAVEPILPADTSRDFDNVVLAAVTASQSQLDAAGTVLRNTYSTTSSPASPSSGTNSTTLKISGTSPNNYVWDHLETGTQMFIDRDYAFADVPATYAGLDYLQTAKNDRTSTGNKLISFTVNVPVTVFVAHANTISDKPGWLGSWKNTGTDILSRSIYRKDFPAGTVVLGGNTVDGSDSGSMYLVFVKPTSSSTGSSGGSTSGGSTPPSGGSTVNVSAGPDSANATSGSPVTINVLANDSGYASASSSSVAIAFAPANGTAQVRSDGRIVYTPASDFSGTDTFTYRITGASGATAVATVSVRVTCSGCSSDINVTLTWRRASGGVLGYLVYYAKGIVSDPALASGAVYGTSVTFDASSGLDLSRGDYACFWVKSFNDVGTSEFSTPVCGTI